MITLYFANVSADCNISHEACKVAS